MSILYPTTKEKKEDVIKCRDKVYEEIPKLERHLASIKTALENLNYVDMRKNSAKDLNELNSLIYRMWYSAHDCKMYSLRVWRNINELKGR